MSGRPCGHESRIGRDVRWSRRTRKAYRPIVGAREFLVMFYLRHDQASAVVLQFSVEVCEVMVVVDVKWLKSPKVAHCRSSTARADHPSMHRLCRQVVSAKRGKSWEMVKIKSGVRDKFSSSRFSQQLSTSFCLQKGKFDKRSRSRLRSSRGKKESGMMEAPGRAVATAHGGVVSSRSKESFA
jgi:hypothetical protein